MGRKHRCAIVTLVILLVILTTVYIWQPDKKPIIFAITPTYSRPTQKPDLVRTCTAFKMAGGIHWIVVEDAVNKSR